MIEAGTLVQYVRNCGSYAIGTLGIVTITGDRRSDSVDVLVLDGVFTGELVKWYICNTEKVNDVEL